MSYVVDGGKIGVGLNWDRSGSRVLTTNIFVKFFQKKIVRKEIVKKGAIIVQRIFYLWPTSGKSKQGCEEHQLERKD